MKPGRLRFQTGRDTVSSAAMACSGAVRRQLREKSRLFLDKVKPCAILAKERWQEDA
jgi:hypothetical protein